MPFRQPTTRRSRAVRAAASLACLAAVCGTSPAAHAFGALAVGMTGSVAKDGIAMGTAFNHDTADAANDLALGNCRKWKEKGAPKAAEVCRVIATFQKECYAIALDPKPGTPGAGWAIAVDKDTASERALAHCRLTAGSDREKFCEVTESNCDVK
jgi:hypothetical protein